MILNVVITILISSPALRTAMAAVLSVTMLAGCTSDEGDGTTGLALVVTTSIWADVVGQIAGEDATVQVLIPRGSDPHDYVPSAGQVAEMSRADLVVANGLGLEEGFGDVLDAARGDGVPVLELAPGLDPLPFADHEEGEDEGHGDDDPHVWFDPDRVARAADAIAARLVEIEPDVDWQSRADSYRLELEQLSEEIDDLIAAIPEESRKLVTNHDMLGYFADRFGMEVVGVVIPGGSTMGEPSSAELAELVRVIESEGVEAIFAETTNPSALAEAVAAESGAEIEVVELFTGTLGDEGSGAETLVDMLRTDARLIADALT